MSTAAVELRRVTVRYGEVVAADEVSLAVGAGEVHAIVGENGAGKSTLMRALFGLVPAARGEVWVGGERVARPTPAGLIARGVGMVHQHFMLVPSLTVAENVVLGAEPRRAGLLDRARAERDVAALGERFGLRLAPAARVAGLSVGEQQRVEIVKALGRGARVLILDEPTAVLAPPEVAELIAVLRTLRAAGATVLLATHKLEEVCAVADRVTVLRRGAVVARFDAREQPLSATAIARAMVGREPAAAPSRGAATPGDVMLSLDGVGARGAGGRAIEQITLEVRAGEVLGIAGVEGNGQRELVDAIAGVLPVTAGTMRLAGTEVTRATVARRRALGLACVPEDRHGQALLLDGTLAENLLLGRERRFATWGAVGRIDRGRLARDAAVLLDRFDVRPADPALCARVLSGGNQQKLVLARELSREPRILLAGQPTRGVDVGAVEMIHRELDGLRRRGAAVLLVSAELPELLALADRIVVLYRGRIVGTWARAAVTSEALGAAMTGAAGAAA